MANILAAYRGKKIISILYKVISKWKWQIHDDPTKTNLSARITDYEIDPDIKSILLEKLLEGGLSAEIYRDVFAAALINITLPIFDEQKDNSQVYPEGGCCNFMEELLMYRRKRINEIYGEMIATIKCRISMNPTQYFVSYSCSDEGLRQIILNRLIKEGFNPYTSTEYNTTRIILQAQPIIEKQVKKDSVSFIDNIIRIFN